MLAQTKTSRIIMSWICKNQTQTFVLVFYSTHNFSLKRGSTKWAVIMTMWLIMSVKIVTHVWTLGRVLCAQTEITVSDNCHTQHILEWSSMSHLVARLASQAFPKPEEVHRKTHHGVLSIHFYSKLRLLNAQISQVLASQVMMKLWGNRRLPLRAPSIPHVGYCCFQFPFPWNRTWWFT